jgi:hypothetical protein
LPIQNLEKQNQNKSDIMDGIERYAGYSDHDLTLITITKLEGLEKKVGEYTDRLTKKTEELENDTNGVKSTVEKLDVRVNTLETVHSTTLWIIGGVSGAAVALLIILFEHLIGGT